jgi:hypothetical protein
VDQGLDCQWHTKSGEKLKTNLSSLKSSSSSWQLYQLFSSTLSNTLNLLKQAQGLWTPKSDNMADLCKQVKQLKGSFIQFQTNHVLRVRITSFQLSCSNLPGIGQL